MKQLSPIAVLELYEEGNITLTELHLRLIQAAASYPPETFVQFIPVEEVQAILTLAQSPPAVVSDCPRYFSIGSWVGPQDHEAEQRQTQRLWYDGIWRWHRFFQENPAE